MSGIQTGVRRIKLEEETSVVKEKLNLIMSKLEDQRSKDEELLKVLQQCKDEEKEKQRAKMEEMREMLLLESNKLTNMIDLLKDFLCHLHRLHSTAYHKDEKNRKLVDKLDRTLRRQRELILFQREQIKKLKSNSPEPAEKKMEVKTQECALKRRLIKELGLSLQALVDLLDNICVELNSVTEKKMGVKKQMSESALRRNKIIKELWQLLVQDLCEELEDFCTEVFCVLQRNVEVKKETFKIPSWRMGIHIMKEFGPLLLQALAEQLEDLWKELFSIKEEKVKEKKQTPKRTCWRSTIIKGLGPLLLLAVLEEMEDFCMKVFSIKEKRAEDKKQMSNSFLRRSSIVKELGSVLLQALLEELEDFCMKAFCTTEKKAEAQKPMSKTPSLKELAPFSSEEDSKEEILAQRPKSVEIRMNEFVVSPADSDTEWTDLSDLEENNHQPEQLNMHSTQEEEETLQGGLIKDLEHLERLFAEKPSKKPRERISPDINVWPKPEDLEKDDNDDDDDNDSDYSDSLEDKPPLTKSRPVDETLDSLSTGFKEAKASSTRKNPVTLTDCSDTEDKIY